jgi:predicted PurR-regulated permease PerM
MAKSPAANVPLVPVGATLSRPVLIAAYVLMAVFLLMVLLKGLLAALFAGLLVYSLIHQITPKLGKRISNERARLLAVAALGVVVVSTLTLAIWGLISFLQSDAGNVHTLLKKLADIIDQSRAQIPGWLQDSLPVDANSLREMLAGWFREHAVEAKAIGAEAGRTLAHILVGMIIGAMLALQESHDPKAVVPPLTLALLERLRLLYGSFRDMVFAQVWISAINAAITAVFVLIILPLFGVSLPLSKSLVAITFFAGLLPVVGNLISNTMFVIIGLSHSLHTAMAALIFMVVVHKLEYFLNARIIGSKIHAHAWELLTVILVAETLFGMAGVIAAPVFYAYMKKELMAAKLI